MVIEEMRSPGDSEATQIRATTGSQAHSHSCRIDGKDSVIGTQKLRLAAGPAMEMQPLPETSQDGEREGRKYHFLLPRVFPPVPLIGHIYLEAREQGNLGNVVPYGMEHSMRGREWI